MSHVVRIDYHQIAIQCTSICEVAEQRLAEMDQLLATLMASSTRLQNHQTQALKKEIERERSALEEQIRTIQNQAAQKRLETTREAQQLLRHANELAADRLVKMRALLDTLLAESVQKHQLAMEARANGYTRLDDQVLTWIESIEDEVLRQFTHIAYVRNPALSNKDLLHAGEALMQEALEDRHEEEAARIRAELVSTKVAPERVEEIVASGKSIQEMQETASSEIVGEKVRQKSVKIIIKAIQERGFIVEKKNIRINRDANEVHITAQKASGEVATFKVYLDGQFIYDFHGYEGQACQKDIQPFMQALEEVYGMHIDAVQELWANPDKIQSSKQQAMRTNTNKGGQ